MVLKSKAIVDILISQKLKIATAESCTGGLLSSLITSIPNSSKIFECGICSYSNDIKHSILNVPKNILEDKGAVSKEVAEYMSIGVKNISNSDIGVSITGIAGPSGGTIEKPVGLVFISICNKNNDIITKKLLLNQKDREYIRNTSTSKALDLIISNI